jgi:hypothetical protein
MPMISFRAHRQVDALDDGAVGVLGWNTPVAHLEDGFADLRVRGG